MSLQDFSGLGLGSLLLLAVFIALFFVKRVVRNRLFPDDREEKRGKAMDELLLFQAELEERAKRDDSSSVEEAGSEDLPQK